MKYKFIVIVISMFLVLTIIDIFLRITGYVPGNLNAYVWLNKHVVLNSDGNWDKEYAREKEDGILRIFAIGDSYTYGWGLDKKEDSYPKQLEKRLQKFGRKVEVINAGNPGFDYDADIDRYLSQGVYFHPDILLLGINAPRVKKMPKVYRFVQIDESFPDFVRKDPLYQVTLGNLLKYLLGIEYVNYLQSIFSENDSPDFTYWKKNMLLLQSEATKNNTQLVFLLYPNIPNPSRPNAPYAFYQYHKKISEFAKAHGIPIVDPLNDFLKQPQKEKFVLNKSDSHPTKYMNKLLVDAFLKEFDIAKFLSQRTVYNSSIQTVTLDNNSRSINDYKFIRKVTDSVGKPINFFFKNIPVKRMILDSSFRQIPFMYDSIELSDSASGDLRIALIYYAQPMANNKIIIPQKPYGYQIAGITSVEGWYLNTRQGDESEYIDPKIEKKDNNYVMTYAPHYRYRLFKLKLQIVGKFVEIPEDGKVGSIIEIKSEDAILPAKSKTLTFTSRNKRFINTFTDGKNNFPYVFADRMFTKVSGIDPTNNSFTIRFFSSYNKDKKIEVSYITDYELSDKESIQVEIER